jgi:hypothetical protein
MSSRACRVVDDGHSRQMRTIQISKRMWMSTCIPSQQHLKHLNHLHQQQFQQTTTKARRQFSQMMKNFVLPKYMLAYRALVLAQLKKRNLGEKEADEILSDTRDKLNLGGATDDDKQQQQPAVHEMTSQLVLSTYQTVLSKTNSKEIALKCAEETLQSAQIFEVSTHKVATMLSWNKRKHSSKVLQDFCKDQSSALDAVFKNDLEGVHVSKCYYAKFFKDQNLPELTQVFCNAEKHLLQSCNSAGLEFQLPQTIAKGDDKCILMFKEATKL